MKSHIYIYSHINVYIHTQKHIAYMRINMHMPINQKLRTHSCINIRFSLGMTKENNHPLSTLLAAQCLMCPIILLNEINVGNEGKKNTAEYIQLIKVLPLFLRDMFCYSLFSTN